MSHLSPAEISKPDDLYLIDVRSPGEFGECHAAAAQNHPLPDLDPVTIMGNHPHGFGEPVYLICQSGARSRKACELFEKAGLGPVIEIAGGTEAWALAGLPVVRGHKAMSIERQVRIAAGALVFLSVVLGLTVHPWLAGLAGFVGAGLVFAGLTDTCGMGMVLAKMPWNRA